MKKITLLLLSSTMILLCAENALACSCRFPKVDTEGKFRVLVAGALDSYEAVFSGEVIGVDKFVVKFKATTVWKGDFKTEITLVTGAEVSGDGLYLPAPCGYNFEQGVRYLVFADGPKGGLRASKCSWTNVLSERERFVNELNRLKQIERSPQPPKASADLFHPRQNLTAACSPTAR